MPPEPTFFTDRDLGKIVPRILVESGLSVERYFVHYGEKVVSDTAWLTFAAQRSWIALSHDKNIRRDPVAVQTVMSESGRLFIIRGVLTGPEKANLFLGALASIRRIISEHHGEAFIGVVRRRVLKGGVIHPEARVALAKKEWMAGKLGSFEGEEEEDSIS